MKKLLIIFILIILSGCSKINYYSHDMFYMDTYINIKIYDIQKKDEEKVFDEINNMFLEYNNLCDKYNEYEELINVYYLNELLGDNVEVDIDPKLSEIITYGIDAYSNTNGLVNIALGNVIDAWDYYKNIELVPTIEELSNTKSIDINDILLEDNKYIKNNGVKIDLGAIAKGYVTELAGKRLEELGYKKYIINSGGNVKVGDHYGGSKYKIGVENPTDVSLLYEVINGNNISVVTSGGYQRYYEYEGTRYHHIIDPITFFPPSYSLSVTVITNDSAFGDILSTYLFLMPIEDGIDYVNSIDDVEAVWYDLSGNIHVSEGFSNYE